MRLLMRWWSGTGNTRRAAGVAAEAFRRAGWEVDTAEVRFDTAVPTSAEIEAADELWIAAPTLGFSAPDHFLKWLARWPDCLGKPVAVLAVGGAEPTRRGILPGWTGSLCADVARPLVWRGARWLAWAEVSYPQNWTQVLPPPAPEVAERIRVAADFEVEAFSERLVAGTAGLPRMGLGRRSVGLFNAVLFRTVARRFLGKLFAADPSCNGCGRCARGCPAGAVVLKAGRPRWSLACDGCNRCINVCPTRAIQVPWVRLGFFLGGNLALGVVSLGWAVDGRPLEAAALYFGASLVQLTAGDTALRWLEANPLWGKAFTRGWTSGWGRYRG